MQHRSNDLSRDFHSFRRRDGEPDPAVPGDGGAAGGGHQGGGQLGNPGRLAARPGRTRRSSGARLYEVSEIPMITKKIWESPPPLPSPSANDNKKDMGVPPPLPSPSAGRVT